MSAVPLALSRMILSLAAGSKLYLVNWPPVTIFPSSLGGLNYSPASYDPATNYVFNAAAETAAEPVVAEWLFFPHPLYRQGLLLRFSRKTSVTLHLPTSLTASIGQAAVNFPMRSGDEVSLSFTTREELSR